MQTGSRIRSIPVGGSTTEVWEYGSSQGQPVLMVHGFRGDHHGLEGLALALCALAPELRIIVPDLPGFGASPAFPGTVHSLDAYGAWVQTCAQELELEPHTFAVVGHSFGSLVVANALAQGLSPAHTTLINPISSPALDGPQAVMSKLAAGFYRVAECLPERTARALLGNPLIVRLMSEVMAKTRDPELRRFIHGQHAAYFSTFANSTALLEAFQASISHTVMEYLSGFTMPTLIVAGDRDDITPLSQQLTLTRSLAQGTLAIMPGVGHLVHYEAVEDTASAMISALRQVSSA